MKITLLFCFFTLVTPISIFIGRETEIKSEKAFVLGRMKVTVIAKETPGKRGFVFIKQLDDEWKIKWTECTQELRSQIRKELLATSYFSSVSFLGNNFRLNGKIVYSCVPIVRRRFSSLIH